ncbi:hypothetical protein JCM3770_004885 [Rhodotorula araucariae]
MRRPSPSASTETLAGGAAEMPASVLHSAHLPSFDRTTGQLALAAHHLVSAPLSVLALAPAAHTLVLDVPPAQPYQQPAQGDQQPRRKRRRTAPPSESASPADFRARRDKLDRQTTTDRESDEHHATIVLDLRVAIEAVQAGWAARARDVGWLGPPDERVAWRERNDDDDRTELDLVGIAAGVASDADDEPIRLEHPHAQLSIAHLFSRIVQNCSPACTTVLDITDNASGDGAGLVPLATLVLPPSSGFLMSDLSTWSTPSSGIAEFGDNYGGWDVVVIDPPWPNASASRSSSYETFDAYDLWKLDLPALLADKPALVAVWLTNRNKFRRLVQDKLFPSWRIKGAAEWYWVKIASETGEPVWPLEAKHRRCYEGLLVGHYVPRGAETVALPSIPQNQVFLSTPIGHSRKPVILDLLRPHLISPSKPPNVLELFARMTLAGAPTPPPEDGAGANEAAAQRGIYLAVGNEAVKFNVLERAGGGVKGWVRREEGTAEEPCAEVHG